MNPPSEAVTAGSSASRPALSSDWLLSLWWLTIRRRWREHGGAMLIAAGILLLLGLAARNAPPGGESFYLTVVFVFASAGIIGAPLVISAESIFSSTRLAILPVRPLTRTLTRLGLGNPFRTAFSLFVLGWSVGVVLAGTSSASVASAELFRICGWLFLTNALSQLLESVIRLRRSFILHQLVFIIGLALWPLVFEFLQDPSNFVPPPEWATGSAGEALFPATGNAAVVFMIGGFFCVTGAFVLVLENAFLGRYGSQAVSEPASTGWTASIARALAGGGSASILLVKELLVPLRFLFLRMTLIFIALSTAAALSWGVPFLLIGLPFWWQPLSTNALGPDVGGGETRYALIGIPIHRILYRRLLAMVLLTISVVVPTTLIVALGGLIVPPRVEPASPVAYPAAFIYGLSLMPLWAVLGDRYSLRFPDSLEMHTLLPERTRSARALAVITLFGLWFVVLAMAAVAIAIATLIVILILPGAEGLPRILLIASIAAAIHIGTYFVHQRTIRTR